MTEDYKKNLIDYMTGNITEGSQTTDEIFKEIIEVDRSSWIGFMPNGWNSMKIEGLIKNNTNDTIILYGGYTTYGEGLTKGLIILIDNNFKPIKYFDKFSSGTDLRYIQAMEQDTDGTFYFVDDTYYAPSENDDFLNGQRRFVMVNNFTIPINDEYSINLRTSYILGTNYKNFYCRKLQKNPESSHYVMIGQTYNNNANRYLGIKAIELKINVGTPNEWSYIQTPQNSDYYQTYGNSFITFNSNDKASYKIITDYLQNKGTHYLFKDYSSNSFTYNLIYKSSYRSDSIDTRNFNNQCVFLNQNEVYFVLTNQRNSWDGNPEAKHIALMYYNFNTNTYSIIFDKPLGTAITETIEGIYLSSNQGKLYINYCVITDSQNLKGTYYVQRYEGTWNPIEISTNKNCSLIQRAFYVNNDYNLVKLFCYTTNLSSSRWYFPIVKEIYNPTQYNGEPYVGVNSLIPLYSNLYSNGSVIFSRNLYNITKQNNITVSSVEIPNNYLNDSTITQNDLISTTNLELINDNTQWTKNIYEVVDLNFLDTISIIDTDTNTPYLEGAIKLNNSTTDGGSTNYQNTPCTKYRINYVDTTTSVNDINWDSIDDLHKETTITIYVDKPMLSIDFISYDETTIYLNIPLDVEENKTYTITQKLKIGE